MNITNDLLFVYGTLLYADNHFAQYLRANSTHYAPGKLKGRLFDIGEYPGLITGTANDYDVIGQVYSLNSAEMLKLIDQYEGYGEGQSQPYLYLREKLRVTTPKGVIECWVYLYNHPVNGLVEIKSGDYLEYLKSTL